MPSPKVLTTNCMTSSIDLLRFTVLYCFTASVPRTGNSTGFGGVLPTGGVVADVTPSSVYVRWDSGVSEWHDLCRSGSVDVSLSMCL